jgi:acyl carrier protein
MTTAQPISSELTSLIAQVLEVDPVVIARESDFTDLGRSSIQEIELLAAIEDHYRITLDYGTFADLKTVGDLSDEIAAVPRAGAR